MLLAALNWRQTVHMQLIESLKSFIPKRPYLFMKMDAAFLEQPKIMLAAFPNGNTYHIRCARIRYNLYLQRMFFLFA